MSSIDEQVQQIKERYGALARSRARAEHDRDAATARLEAITAQLREEFNVSTVEDAKACLAQLRNDLGHQIELVIAHLDRAEQQ